MATKSTSNSIPFRTAYSEKERSFSPHGDNRHENTYAYDIDSMGRKILIKNGERNLYEEIQAYEEETRIEVILRKVSNGDTSMLRPEGAYADISEMPTNLIEAKKSMMKLENMFNSLPIEIKAKYNMDVNQFMSQMGTEAWLLDTGLLKPAQAPKTDLKEVATGSVKGTEEATE